MSRTLWRSKEKKHTFLFSFCFWTLLHEVVIPGAIEPSCDDRQESLRIQPRKGRQQGHKPEESWVLDETWPLHWPNPKLPGMPPGFLGLGNNKLSLLFSDWFGNYLFLEAKRSHVWQVGLLLCTPQSLLFCEQRLIYEAPELNRYHLNLAPLRCGLNPHLQVGMLRPRKQTCRQRLSWDVLWSCAHSRAPRNMHPPTASRTPGRRLIAVSFCNLMHLAGLQALNIHISSSSSLHILISGVTSLD